MKRLSEMSTEERLSRHYPVGIVAEGAICHACEGAWPCDVALALRWRDASTAELMTLRDKAALYDAFMASGIK